LAVVLSDVHPGIYEIGGLSFLCAVFTLAATSMDISAILQELSPMKYDLITVRSTRTPYKVSRPADVYDALKRYTQVAERDPYNQFPLSQRAIARYATSKVEKFFAISLDGQHAILHINIVSIGTTNRCMAVPRDIFHATVKDQATALVVAHVHPSGNNSPSVEDRDVTSRIREAGEVLGIPVLDHIVFSKTGYTSFVESGLLEPAKLD
jgi:DNA repair protein RadC